jgi:hypothetical protein
MHDVSKSKDMVNVFSRAVHHKNISIIFLTQVFFYKNLNPLTRQLKYLICMKNPRENAHINVIGRQMNNGKSNRLLEFAYKDAMSKPFGYILIDYSQLQCDKYRIRSSVFPEEAIIYSE